MSLCFPRLPSNINPWGAKDESAAETGEISLKLVQLWSCGNVGVDIFQRDWKWNLTKGSSSSCDVLRCAVVMVGLDISLSLSAMATLL